MKGKAGNVLYKGWVVGPTMQGWAATSNGTRITASSRASLIRRLNRVLDTDAGSEWCNQNPDRVRRDAQGRVVSVLKGPSVVRKKAGKPARPVVSKRESLKLSTSEWIWLSAIAEAHHCFYLKKPSWRQLIRKIAIGDIDVRVKK